MVFQSGERLKLNAFHDYVCLEENEKFSLEKEACKHSNNDGWFIVVCTIFAFPIQLFYSM